MSVEWLIFIHTDVWLSDIPYLIRFIGSFACSFDLHMCYCEYKREQTQIHVELQNN